MSPPIPLASEIDIAAGRGLRPQLPGRVQRLTSQADTQIIQPAVRLRTADV